MRPIKFRAWSRQEKEMVYAEPCEFDKSIWSRTDDKIPLMQFTGLHDKTGKEIWEGDVVDDGDGAAIVEWLPGHCSFVLKPLWENPEHSYYWFNKGTFSPKDANRTKLTETEVLGNIYEHPQLLSDQKLEGRV